MDKGAGRNQGDGGPERAAVAVDNPGQESRDIKEYFTIVTASPRGWFGHFEQGLGLRSAKLHRQPERLNSPNSRVDRSARPPAPRGPGWGANPGRRLPLSPVTRPALAEG